MRKSVIALSIVGFLGLGSIVKAYSNFHENLSIQEKNLDLEAELDSKVEQDGLYKEEKEFSCGGSYTSQLENCIHTYGKEHSPKADDCNAEATRTYELCVSTARKNAIQRIKYGTELASSNSKPL